MNKAKLVKLKETESTNLYALNNINNFEDKHMITADYQTKGRGRFNRDWIADDSGNLYLSIVLKPQSDSYPYANLTQYLSIVVCKVLEDKYNVKAEIKWPNDILADGKKLAGILCETSTSQNKINALVLGLGVNLNLRPETINIIDQKAASLHILTGKNIDRDEFLSYISEEFFSRYEEFAEKGFDFIKTEYVKRCTFLGKKLKISSLDKNENYMANSINNDGTLSVSDKNNNQIKITAGDLALC